MIDYLQQIDTNLFLWLNGFHNSFFDSLMWFVSEKFIWVPMYTIFLYVILKKYKSHHLQLFLIAMFFINFAISDFFCGNFLRHLICRPRPANMESPIWQFVHIINGYRGGHYGFPSCHAANSLGLAMLTYLLFRRKRMALFMFSWAAIHSYSRIYLGVHYPGDIFVGAIIGITTASCVFLSFQYLLNIRHDNSKKYINLIPYTGLTIMGILTLLACLERIGFNIPILALTGVI
ncbi:MAG: phosphatase PAP2 family protein [Phocaeicola sp.]|uniref:phosphatase PAP2 family protein n=1 Tax=Phocaeicola sp. TaxID=2773926 RepID=UPI003FA15463